MKQVLSLGLLLGFVIGTSGCERRPNANLDSIFKPQYDDAMDAKHYCDAEKIAYETADSFIDDPGETYFQRWQTKRSLKKWEERSNDAADKCKQQKEEQQTNSNTDISQIGGDVQTAEQANAAYSGNAAPAPVTATESPVSTAIPTTSAPAAASEPQTTTSTTALPTTSSTSADGRVIECRVDSNGSPSYSGKCLFFREKGGSFSLQNVNKESTIAGALTINVFVEKGNATVSGLTKDGLNSRWGDAQRSSKEKACWVGSDFKVCAW